MKPKNVLIFGASGQIGRHIIRKLTKNSRCRKNCFLKVLHGDGDEVKSGSGVEVKF